MAECQLPKLNVEGSSPFTRFETGLLWKQIEASAGSNKRLGSHGQRPLIVCQRGVVCIENGYLLDKFA